jgi:NTP pyrophosphatase (non-canonical NTP hydrolase)
MSDPRFIQHGFDKVLSHCIEECGEVLAAAGKTQRWGPLSTNPLIPFDERETNLTWLRRELCDLLDVIARLDSAMQDEFQCAALQPKEPGK